MSFIRCPECGFCIGMYTDFIDKARQALNAEVVFNKDSEYANYDPEKMAINLPVTPSLEKIFDALELIICCRMHLVAKTDFDRTYK